MRSKISVHVTSGPRGGYGEFLERTKDVPLSCVVVVDQFGAALEAKQANPAIVTIGRSQKKINGIDPAGMDRWAEGAETPERAAEIYYEAYSGIWKANPHIDIWITWNEWSFHWGWQSDFNIALAELSKSKGDPWRWGFMGWSSGNPPGITEGDFSVVREVLPCLWYAKQHGHVLCTHEYTGAIGFHPGRYRSLYRFLKDPYDEDGDSYNKPADCDLYITESGFVTYPGEEALMQEVRMLDGLYAGDNYLKGSAIFTLGRWTLGDAPDAPDANIQAAVPEPLAQHIVTYTPPDTPPEEPPTEPLIARVVNVLPQDSNGLQEDAVLHEIAANRQSFIWSLHDARDIVKLGKPESLVVVWGGPQHWQNEGGYIGVADFLEWHDVRFRQFPDETEPPPTEPERLSIVWPTDAEPHVITWLFGQHGDVFHKGLDTRAPEGTRVRAVADGVVKRIDWDTAPNGGFGLYIRIESEVGGKQYKRYHSHLLDDIIFVTVGERVTQGQHIAYSGNTGNSSGAHHHLEIREKRGALWVPVDPMDYMREDQKPGESPPEPEPPTAWQGIRGVGWRADGGALRKLDVQAFDQMKLRGVKLQTSDSRDTAKVLTTRDWIRPIDILVRFFVPPAKWGETGYTAERFVEEARLAINESWLEGIRWFELFNEPNLLSEYPSGDAIEFTHFAIEAMLLLREEWPEIKLVSSGLSPQANTESWWRMFADLGFLDRCDGLGAHHYGADANDLLHGRRSYLGLEQYLRGNQQIHLTEFSINRASETDAVKGHAYVEFWDSLEPVVARADIFVLSAGKHGENLYEKHRETLVRQTGEISEIVNVIGRRDE